MAMQKPHLHGASAPGHRAVRSHALAMSQQALGLDVYQQDRLEILESALEIMELILASFIECSVFLVGRAASGMLDADPSLRIRLLGRLAPGTVAETLVSAGMEEPVFDTIDTTIGRLERLRFIDEGLPVVITICPPESIDSLQVDLVRNMPIKSLDIEQLRQLLDRS